MPKGTAMHNVTYILANYEKTRCKNMFFKTLIFNLKPFFILCSKGVSIISNLQKCPFTFGRPIIFLLVVMM